MSRPTPPPRPGRVQETADHESYAQGGPASAVRRDERGNRNEAAEREPDQGGNPILGLQCGANLIDDARSGLGGTRRSGDGRTPESS